MTSPRLLLLGLVAVLCWPTAADAQQSRRDRAEQQIRERCGDDRACAQRMRDEMRERRQGDQTPAADPPQRTRQQGGAATGGALPARAQAALDALPPDVRRDMLERCGDDRDCLRRAMRRYQQQQQAGATTQTVDRQPAAGQGTPARGGPPAVSTASGADPTGTRGGTVPVGATPRSGNATPAPPPPAGAPAATGPRTSTPRDASGTVRDAVQNGQEDESPLEQFGVILPVNTDPTTRYPPAAGPESPAEIYFHYADSGSTTDISGQGGSSNFTKEPGNGAFLIGIESEEQGDIPCGWRFLWYRDNDSDATQGYFTTRGGECETVVQWFDSWGSSWHKDATIDHIDSPSDDDVRAVRSIEVCMNRAEDRIKGVRVWGAHIDTDGRVSSDDNLFGEIDRTNCHDWSTRRSCPSGEVAVGIKVDVDRSSAAFGATGEGGVGMRLVCGNPYTETN